MVRLYMTFKSISDGYLMPTLIAGIANTLMLRFCMFLTLHRVVKKNFNTFIFTLLMVLQFTMLSSFIIKSGARAPPVTSLSFPSSAIV